MNAPAPQPPPGPGFLTRWFRRFKAFCLLAGTWGVLFSVNSILGFRSGIEYDDGLVYSTPAFVAAEKDGLVPGTPDYWNAINRSYAYERIKPVPWLTAWALKAVGVRVDIFCDRGAEGADSLEAAWRRLASEIYFVGSENEKYELLEKGRYALFAAASDAGIIQARKAGVWPLRIGRSASSVNPLESNPRKFGERVLPLSGF